MNANGLFDYDIMDDYGDFTVTSSPTFSWPSHGFTIGSSHCRSKPGVSAAAGTKACREKLRRDKLNERYHELGAILESGVPPKRDKAAIVSDAVKMVTKLKIEAQKLKESNAELREKVIESKNEFLEEKQRLRSNKEKLEQHVNEMNAKPGHLPNLSAMHAAYASQRQTAASKVMPVIGYPGVAMWQFMPPATIDISQDHVLCPPVA